MNITLQRWLNFMTFLMSLYVLIRMLVNGITLELLGIFMMNAGSWLLGVKAVMFYSKQGKTK